MKKLLTISILIGIGLIGNTQIYRLNSISQTQVMLGTNITYDQKFNYWPNNSLESIVSDGWGAGNPIWEVHYTYDSLGRVITKRDYWGNYIINYTWGFGNNDYIALVSTIQGISGYVVTQQVVSLSVGNVWYIETFDRVKVKTYYGIGTPSLPDVWDFRLTHRKVINFSNKYPYALHDDKADSIIYWNSHIHYSYQDSIVSISPLVKYSIENRTYHDTIVSKTFIRDSISIFTPKYAEYYEYDYVVTGDTAKKLKFSECRIANPVFRATVIGTQHQHAGYVEIENFRIYKDSNYLFSRPLKVFRYRTETDTTVAFPAPDLSRNSCSTPDGNIEYIYHYDQNFTKIGYNPTSGKEVIYPDWNLVDKKPYFFSDYELTNTFHPFYKLDSISVFRNGVYVCPIIFHYDVVTEIPEFETRNVAIYPNPTTGLVNIKGEFDYVEVYSITGALLIKTKELLDLSAYPTGIYILKVYTTNEIYQTKIIKQ